MSKQLDITPEVLAMSGFERIAHAGNFKRLWDAVMVDGVAGFKPNAKLDAVVVSEHDPNAPEAKLRFSIDRKSEGVPFNEKDPTPELTRHVRIRRMTAAELSAKYGDQNGMIQATRTATTKELAEVLNQQGIPMGEEDVFLEDIPSGAQCILLRFRSTSYRYVGSILVSLSAES